MIFRSYIDTSVAREGLIKLLKGRFTGRSPALAGDFGI
jgi:hypothetical protein